MDSRKDKLLSLIEEIGEEKVIEAVCPGLLKDGLSHAPYRQDSVRSFSIYRARENRLHPTLRYKMYDQAYGKTYDIIDLLFKLYNSYSNVFNYLDCIEVPINVEIKSMDLQLTIRPSYGQWNESQLEWWANQGVCKDVLDYKRIRPATAIYYGANPYPVMRATATNPIYVYEILCENEIRYSIYRPLAPNRNDKFRNNLTPLVVQGLDLLSSHGDVLLLNKSYKDDAAALSSLGLPSISMNGETKPFPIKTIEALKQRFNLIIGIGDNDKPGRIAATNHQELLGVQYIEFPENLGKDLTDCIRADKNYTISWFNETIVKIKQLHGNI